MQVELLAHLDLTGNLIDDNRARLLSAGLANNHTITHLCLAHNKVAAPALSDIHSHNERSPTNVV